MDGFNVPIIITRVLPVCPVFGESRDFDLSRYNGGNLLQGGGEAGRGRLLLITVSATLSASRPGSATTVLIDDGVR